MSHDDTKRVLGIKLEGMELGDEALDALAHYIADLQAQGFGTSDVFPIGIVRPDLIGLETRIPPDDLARLRQLLDDPKLTELKVFPKGIIAPRELQVAITRRR